MCLAAIAALALPGAAHADPGDLSAYVRARAADAAGDGARATRDYAAALAAAPDNPVIAIRAYREALAAGDQPLVDRAIAVLARAGVAPADAALQPLAAAAGAGDARAAEAGLAALSQGALAPLIPALAGWIAFARHRDPFAPLAAAAADPVARRLAAEARALLLIASGRPDDGLAATRALLAVGAPRPDLRFDAARLLAAQGRREQALALLEGDDPVLSRLRGGLGRKAKPSLGFGVSRLFTMLGADLVGDEPSPLVVALARAALRADPANDRARLLLADELNREGEPARALVALDAIGAESAFAGVAHTSRVTVLQALGQAPATLAAARELSARADASPYDIQRYGDLLMLERRPDDAAREYARVVAASPHAADAWLQYAGALDEAKRWPEARAALEQAVRLGPDEPLALNYLGYARIAHGEAVAQSEAMLEKAARLKPDDASITDSLAWAYVRRGAVARALPMLERARAGEPGNATIAEHLGDAYWGLGRRYEARYAWREAAALFDADGPDATRLGLKIASGPSAAGGATP